MRPASLLLLAGALSAQETTDWEIPVISRLVGASIDIPEQEYYRIFGEIEGFLTAQFIQQGESFEARIRTRDGWERRRYTPREFYDLGLAIDLTGEIDPQVLAELSGETVYRAKVADIQALPTGVRMTLHRREGRAVRGTFAGFEGHHFILTGRRRRPAQRISVGEVTHLNYRDPPVVQLLGDRRIYMASALAGMGAGVLWNMLRNVSIFEDRASLNFKGALLGLALSPLPVRIVRVRRAAVHGFQIELDVQDKIRTYLYLHFGES